jgi:hypothetical protein
LVAAAGEQKERAEAFAEALTSFDASQSPSPRDRSVASRPRQTAPPPQPDRGPKLQKQRSVVNVHMATPSRIGMADVAMRVMHHAKVVSPQCVPASKMREAARKVKSILLVQAAFRGHRVRKHIKRSGIMGNLLVSPTAVRNTLRDVAEKHKGLGRLLLHALLAATFLGMVALQAGTALDQPDPYHVHTSLLRRLDSVVGEAHRGADAVESPLGVWDVLHGVVDNLYAAPLVGRAMPTATAEPRFDNTTRGYLGCARPMNSSVLLSREDGVDASTQTMGRGYIDGTNRLLHSLIVVQQRRLLQGCASSSPALVAGGRGTRPFENEPGRLCQVDGSQDTAPFSVRGSAAQFTYQRLPSAWEEAALEWSGFPFAFDLGIVGVGPRAVQCKMEWLRDAGWLDTRRTSEVKAVLAAYNPNAGSLFSLAIMQWSFPVAGGREFNMRSYTLSGRSLSPLQSDSLSMMRVTALWGLYAAFVALLAGSTLEFMKRASKKAAVSRWKYTENKPWLAGMRDSVKGIQAGARNPLPRDLASVVGAATRAVNVDDAKASARKKRSCINCAGLLEWVRVQGCSKRAKLTRTFWILLDFFVLALLHTVWIWWIVLAAKRQDLDVAFKGARSMMVEPAASVYSALESGAAQDAVLLVDANAASAIIAADRTLIDVLINVILYKRVVIVLSMLMVFRFFRLLQFHKRTALIGELISIAASELAHYLVVYIPVHVALVWTAVLLYGNDSAEFHTFGSSLHFLTIVFIGDPIIPEEVLAGHSISPYFFFWM